MTTALLLAAANHQPTFAQGPLTPSGTPAPLMKTLQQIEPRTDLQATPMPAGVATDANFHFIISQPGSYYLSANLEVSKASGIQVAAAGVTLDLNGFRISRATGTGGVGVSILATSHRCVVKNGSVSGFGDGVSVIPSSNDAQGGAFLHLAVADCTGVGLRTGAHWQVAHCSSMRNGSVGMSIRAYSTVRDCVAGENGAEGISGSAEVVISKCVSTQNGGDGILTNVGGNVQGVVSAGNEGDGIRVGAYSNVVDSDANNNKGGRGIYAASGSTISRCSAGQNTSSGSFSYGIYAAGPSTIVSCTATRNGTSSGVAAPSAGIGIYAVSGSLVRDCTASDNYGDGIRVLSGVRVLSNHCDRNGLDSGATAGIHVTGDRSRIEGNSVSQSGRGIQVDGTKNLIVSNSAAANAVNYEIAADNRYGAIIDLTATGTAAVSGNTAAATTGSTSPWANFAY